MEESIEKFVAMDRYQVTARGMQGYEGVMVADEAIAAEQRKIYADAGYKEIEVDLRTVMISTETGKGYIPMAGIPLPGVLTTVHREVVAARLTRAGNNPGVKVDSYNRYYREQRTTGMQLVAAVIFMLMVGGAPGFFFGMVTSGTWLKHAEIYRWAYIGSWAVITIYAVTGIPYLRRNVILAGKQFAGIGW